MKQSMSRVACCLDNGPTEGLWGIIKTKIHQTDEIHSKEDLVQAISKYIDFYNNRRYQARFESKTPMEVRNEAVDDESPNQYSIACDPRIVK